MKREPEKNEPKILAKNEENKAEKDILLNDLKDQLLASTIQFEEIKESVKTLTRGPIPIHLELILSDVWDYDKLKKTETIDILNIDGTGISFLLLDGEEERFINTLKHLIKVTNK